MGDFFSNDCKELADESMLTLLFIDSEKYKANGYKEYYVEYLKKQEVDEAMDSIKLTDAVDKFYSFKKFKYLPIKESDITALGAIKID